MVLCITTKHIYKFVLGNNPPTTSFENFQRIFEIFNISNKPETKKLQQRKPHQQKRNKTFFQSPYHQNYFNNTSLYLKCVC